ncbi:hypothetical protein H4217_005029 [Coemansia sp. RSA 1939]|nr:hypothetical protein H4217_005029 [Coemansia sp. RSA 1939]KAJ2608730.1 hypothetical protein EV177_004824 [Coemansia sp. RSA 1804]
MPLLHGQPEGQHAAQPTDNTSNPTAPAGAASQRTQGWEIRYTGEVFSDYDKYLDRVTLYRKRAWTCKDSGQAGLTYEQAQLSERAYQHRATGVGFSDMLVCEMLTFLSQSSLPIALAIDALYYRFQYDFFVGEHIDVKYPGTDGEMYECFVVTIHPLPSSAEIEESFINGAAESRANGGEPQLSSPSATTIAIERLGNMATQLVAYEQRKQRVYTVRLYDVEGNAIPDSDISVPAIELSRSRNVFTKVALRQFLDEHMRRDPRPGSPWIVLPQWRDRFRIPYMFGGEACLLRAPTTKQPISRHTHYAATPSAAADAAIHLSKAPAEKKPVVAVDPYADERDPALKIIKKFPVEDLDLVNYRHVKWNDGIVWALRRRQQKQQDQSGSNKLATSTTTSANGSGSSRKITEFFSVNSTANGQGSDAEEKHDSDTEEKKEEEEEEEEEEALQNRWPIPLTAWQTPPHLVSRMLAAYMFVSFFSTPLALAPYSLDYFESALVHRLSDNQITNNNNKNDDNDSSPSPTAVCSVYRDTVIALLNSLIDDRQRNRAALPNNVTARIELMSDDHEDEEEKEADEKEKEEEEKSAKDAASMEVDETTSDSSSSAASGLTGAAALRALKASKATGSRVMAKSRLSQSSSATEAAKEDSDKTETDTEEEAVAALSGRALLRHAAKKWWESSTIGAARTGWAWRLVGWLCEAQYDYAELKPIVSVLSNSDASPLTVATIEQTLWHDALSLEQRLLVIELLAAECANNENMRDYLDECTATTAELKRERVDLRREQKRVAEQLGELNREDADADQESSATNAGGADQEAIQALVAGSSRAQGRKEKEQSVHRQKERRKLGESERQLQRRLDYIDREIRRNNVSRLAPLGTDRFFNKYYFIDGIGGCPMSNGGGRILVQAASRQEREGVLQSQPYAVGAAWALEMPPPWTGGLQCGPRDRGLQELAFPPDQLQVGPDLHSADDGDTDSEPWGYYAAPSQIDALKRWLDPRGRRDSALAGELDLLQTIVSTSIRRRCHVLERSFDARVRIRNALCDQIEAAAASASAQAGDNGSGVEEKEKDDSAAETARLREELARIDCSPVAQALLPPYLLVEKQQQRPDDAENPADPLAAFSSSRPLEPADGSTAAGSVCSGVGGGDAAAAGGGNADSSSRASSVEPAAFAADLFVQQVSMHISARRQGATRPMRGRRPKNHNGGSNRFGGGGKRPKMYVDDFMGYENGLLQ